MSTISAAAAIAVRNYYRLVDAHDVDGLLALFAPEAVYHRPGYAPLVGHPDLERFYRADRVIASGEHALHAVLASDDKVAAYGEFRGTLKDGNRVTVRFADFFAVREDGRFVRRDTFFFSPVV